LLLSAFIGVAVAGLLFVFVLVLMFEHGIRLVVLPVVVRGKVAFVGVPPLVVVVVDVLALVCVVLIVVPFVVTVVLFVVPAAVLVEGVGTVPVDVVPLQFVCVEFGTVGGVPGVVCASAGSVRLTSIAATDAPPKSVVRELMLSITRRRARRSATPGGRLHDRHPSVLHKAETLRQRTTAI
jgi:hypothetical protein